MKTRLPTSTLVTVLAVGLLVVSLTALVAPWAAETWRDDGSPADAPSAQGTYEQEAAAQRRKPVKSVLLVSVDGLSPAALERLGPKKTPHLHRLMKQGTSTLNARTMVEESVTMPNHTSMVTGRRVDPAQGGHGITYNKLSGKPSTVHGAVDERVESIFSVVDESAAAARCSCRRRSSGCGSAPGRTRSTAWWWTRAATG